MPRPHVLILICCAFLTLSCSGTSPLLLPGKLPDGRTQLPNGWILSPAGKSIGIGELPLNMDVTPDERYLIVANNGTGEQNLSIIDLNTGGVVQTVPLRKAWLGLKYLPKSNRIAVSGGNDNRVFLYDFRDGQATLADSIVIGQPWPVRIWAGGLDADESLHRLYITGKENDTLYLLDLEAKNVVDALRLPAKPYTCLVSRSHPYLYVSLWGGSAVAVFDRATMKQVSTIAVGDHPCDMLESPDGKRLFVANANENTVSVIDIEKQKVTETLSSALFPSSPAGSTPNSMAITPDGTTLYIANADNNDLAVMDVSVPGKARSLGFIPTGWYPTCVRVLPKHGSIAVANGKGGSSLPNPQGPNPEHHGESLQYIGSLFKGTLSIINRPTIEELKNYTQQVYRNSPYTPARKESPGADKSNPIPSTTGERSPIKYVFYVIKENRTYDQVFGDIKGANGVDSLCLFPDSITPNLHALVRQFVLLDNLYADAEVSADGHNWSMAAYATDYTEKTWPTEYGDRGGDYEYEGGYPIVSPSAGYLWDNCNRHGLCYRSYGEFATNPGKEGDTAKGLSPALVGHVAPFYHSWDLDFSDVDRVREWMTEFDEYDRTGVMPVFQIIKLPNDHTAGTAKGKLTPKAFVAQNDYALGLLVERISKSRFWKESAIFMIEDDAQNGPDHVDAHRTEALVISPYTKHGNVDSDLYSTSSMVRTIELILGLPPLSEFDASSTPMYNSFSATPDYLPYMARSPRIDIHQRNLAGVYGQDESGQMDFSREDAAPDIRLNEIIWNSVKSSPMPAPIRSAFVRDASAGKEEQD